MKKTMVWMLTLALVLAYILPACAASSQKKFVITGPYEIEQTEVEFPSRDVTLTGILTVPQNDQEKYPIAILTHGFMGDTRDTNHLAEYLGKHGIVALQINLMGSGTSGGLYVDSDFTTQPDDILNALAYAKTLDVVDTKNIFLVGKSQGGFDSGLAALQCEEEINGLCMWFPALCIPDDFRSGKVMTKTFDVNDIPDSVVMREGYEVSKGMIEQAMAMHIEEIFPNFSKDVLIIHGEKDPIVNISYSLQIAPLYPHATLIIIPKGVHGFSGQNELDALAYTYTFIMNHIAE